MVMFKAKP